MHLSLAGSAVLMLLLLLAFFEVQPEPITRDVDNGQLTDNRRNLQSWWKSMALFQSLDKRAGCGGDCSSDSDCPPYCPDCTSNMGCM
uniref:Conotoxin n=1 Tax=Conus andremenezi TaxID=1077466 RepID=A0A291C1Z1_9COND|nr:conotoxin [Conus andremenezi]